MTGMVAERSIPLVLRAGISQGSCYHGSEEEACPAVTLGSPVARDDPGEEEYDDTDGAGCGAYPEEDGATLVRVGVAAHFSSFRFYG